VKRQCELLRVPRSTAYYRPAEGVDGDELALMRLIDKIHVQHPFKGSRRITGDLRHDHGSRVNRKRVRRLMQLMGISAIYPKPKTTKAGRGPGHKVFPYLLNGLKIAAANAVWCADISYIPMARGFCYLVAIMDVASRRILAWRLSNTLDARFCVAALEEALVRYGAPTIFNTDQGAQFTSEAFTGVLQAAGVRISMDGRGAWRDNVFIERFWWSLKHEEVYLWAYDSVWDARRGISNYIGYYNVERSHSSLQDRTPVEAYSQSMPPAPRLPAQPQAQVMSLC
jgi:putative transposase